MEKGLRTLSAGVFGTLLPGALLLGLADTLRYAVLVDSGDRLHLVLLFIAASGLSSLVIAAMGGVELVALFLVRQVRIGKSGSALSPGRSLSRLQDLVLGSGRARTPISAMFCIVGLALPWLMNPLSARILEGKADMDTGASWFFGIPAAALLTLLLSMAAVRWVPRLGGISRPAAASVIAFLFLVWGEALFFPVVWNRTWVFALLAPVAMQLAIKTATSQRRPAVPMGMVAALLSLALVPVAWWGLESSGALRASVALHAPLSGTYLKWIRAVGDRDRDGYAAWLGGGDCDDRNPDINPRALEMVGNGKDDNCMGGDLARFDPPPVSAEAATAPVARNLIVISIDALRADLARDPIAFRQVMPNASRLASVGVRFQKAYTEASFTDGSFMSLWTGRPLIDAHDGVAFFGMDTTLARILLEKGFRTVAVEDIPEASIILSGFSEVHNELAGLNAGYRGITSAKVANRAIRLLADHDRQRPLFLWVHFYDPHGMYMTHPGFERFGFSLKGRYLQEVAYTDRHLGRLLDEIERRGFLEDSIVALFGDHGETLGERGVVGHAVWLYDEAVRVPLIIHAPSVPPRSVTAGVSHLDLFPTFLDLLGLRSSPPRDGTSLVPLFRADSPSPKPVFLETCYEPGRISIAVVEGRYKAIHHLSLGAWELFDMESDPGERRNRIDDEPGVAERLSLELGRWRDREYNDRAIKAKLGRLGLRDPLQKKGR